MMLVLKYWKGERDGMSQSGNIVRAHRKDAADCTLKNLGSIARSPNRTKSFLFHILVLILVNLPQNHHINGVLLHANLNTRGLHLQPSESPSCLISFCVKR